MEVLPIGGISALLKVHHLALLYEIQIKTAYLSVSFRTTMDKVKCISDVFGVAEREEIIKYVEKNWRTINYEQTIERLLKIFKQSIQGDSEISSRKRKYVNICERWSNTHANLKLYGVPISGHFDTCEGDDRCDCRRIIFALPREIICDIANAYYPVQCIVQQIRSNCPISEVKVNFNNNWRRMDLKMVIEELMKILHSINSNALEGFNYLYDVCKMKDPETMQINHCPYECRFNFDKFGLYDCHCTLSAYHRGPVFIINCLVSEIYEERNKNKKCK